MSDNPNADLIETFYEAFNRHDAEAMAACYAPDVVFRDPAFGELHGSEAGDMWRMLTRASKDLKVTADSITASPTAGSCHWDAYYTFSLTKQKVHNSVDTTFEFKDGLITRHTDDFNFRTWAGQALTPVGGILAITPIPQFTLQKLARRQLGDFHKKQELKRHS